MTSRERMLAAITRQGPDHVPFSPYIGQGTRWNEPLRWFCDIPWFLVQLYDAPDFVEEFLAIFQEWSLALADLALEAGVDVVQRRGWYEIPTFWGQEHFRRFLAPLIEEETRLVHAAGKLHCYLLPEGHGALARELKSLSVDVLMGIDPRMLHGGNLKTLFEQLGDAKSFWGGVNAEVTLESEDHAAVEEEVKTAVETLAANNGGLILGAFLFGQVPQNSISLMVEAWKKYRDLWRG